MKKIISLSFILILVLSGCTTSQTTTQVVQASPTPAVTSVPENTSKPPVPTLTESETTPASTEIPNTALTSSIAIKISTENASTLVDSAILEGTLTEIASSPDGKWIGYASSIGFELLDQKNNQVIASIASDSPINSINFSPDSSLLVIGMENGRIAIYRITDLTSNDPDVDQPVLEFKAHSLPVTSVQFGKTSAVVISTSSDRTAVTWNAETGKRIHTFAGFDADISTLVFSPDYRFIAVGSYDGTIRIWNVNSGHLWREYGESDGTRKLRAEYPSALLFDQSTGRLISGWGDGTIRIWQWEFGNEKALTISLGENSIIDLIQYNTTNMISVDFYGNAILFNMASAVNQVGVEKLQEFSLGKSIQSIVLLPADQILLLGRSPAQIDAFHLDGGEVNTLFSSGLQ